MAVPIAAVFSSLLAVLFLVLGPFGILGFPFVGVPVVRAAHRNGLAAGLLAAALAAVLLTAASSIDSGAGATASPLVLMGLVAGLPAFFSGLVAGGANPSREYLALAVSGCVVIGGILLLPPTLGSKPVGEDVAAAFDAMIPGAVASYSKANVDAETVARVQATLEAARDFSRRYWLGLVGAFWVLGCAVTFYAGAKSARPAPSADRTRFETLALPAFLAPAFVAAGAVFALAKGSARQAAGEVLFPLSALYFVAGLSIICHFARKWFRVRILRIGLYALVVYVPMNIGVALLGLFDWYADFRHRGGEAERESQR
ncbi:MAG: DUF2232 domain-containing protein [Thermoanaerobaculia bacterium]